MTDGRDYSDQRPWAFRERLESSKAPTAPGQPAAQVEAERDAAVLALHYALGAIESRERAHAIIRDHPVAASLLMSVPPVTNDRRPA